MKPKRRPLKENVRRVGHIGGQTGRNIPGVRMNKAGRRVQFESHSEELLMQRLDRDRTVVDYISQPEQLAFLDDHGKSHTYIPDLKVIRSDGSIELHEVSMSSRRVEPRIARREEAARRICRTRGWKYIVHTEHDLPDLTEQANLRILEGYRATIYKNNILAESVRSLLVSGAKMGLRTLILALASQYHTPIPSVTGVIFHMMWQGELDFNIKEDLLLIDSRITNKVIISLPGAQLD